MIININGTEFVLFDIKCVSAEHSFKIENIFCLNYLFHGVRVFVYGIIREGSRKSNLELRM
ncbi:MAG: hypothetical protein BWX92_02552 [Deltaproteobacteria bacterium ADurb.Bin135]|nr:MAG: hypothetical protein BWX92_02552 [Deltaproteobacteria bacterium ADurb.Bin135]